MPTTASHPPSCRLPAADRRRQRLRVPPEAHFTAKPKARRSHPAPTRHQAASCETRSMPHRSPSKLKCS
ncbi:hypothetical protein BDV95DRAFT_565958 [Massariosphaeria phaeospora]|uniref:Uncharacterized protein n=1 Tax=Massariosphaeria phaeospora TaxID=100035 RepID=A0A7C8MBU8_9PLEO|nr:hypothetical protein BDV95DRAFT_565958 [Massariosphaeria phaeospora]